MGRTLCLLTLALACLAATARASARVGGMQLSRGEGTACMRP